MTISSVGRLPAPGAAPAAGGAAGSTRAAMLASTRSASLRERPRGDRRFSCARRSFDAATIFMALVICCVDLTARMRRRMSISDGIWPAYAATPARRPRTPSPNSFSARSSSALSSSSIFFFSAIAARTPGCRASRNR